jgi:hypothetical protein
MFTLMACHWGVGHHSGQRTQQLFSPSALNCLIRYRRRSTEIQAALSIQIGPRQDGSGWRDAPSAYSGGVAEVASGASARVRGCWGKLLWRSNPPGDEGGRTVYCGREAKFTRQRAGQTRSTGSGWAKASQSGIGSGASSPVGGPRAGAIEEVIDVEGNPRNVRCGMYCRRRCPWSLCLLWVDSGPCQQLLDGAAVWVE